MATECIPQVTFEFYEKLRPVMARIDQAQASTDGGSCSQRWMSASGLTDQLAAFKWLLVISRE